MEKRDRVSLEWRDFAELSPGLLYELLQFRQAIFVVEQASPYADLDGLDAQARHLLLRVDAHWPGISGSSRSTGGSGSAGSR